MSVTKPHRVRVVALTAVLSLGLGSTWMTACTASPSPSPFTAEGRSELTRAASESLLLEKARQFEAAIQARHLTREGLFLYVVDLDGIADQLRAGTVPAFADTPTYTGLFAATSCLRARVETGRDRTRALADAGRALDGLRFLMEVTGRPGLLARGIQRAPAPPMEARDPEHRWFEGAPPHQEWVWRGDASQDQYANGLLPAVAACHELFPDETRDLITSTAELLSQTNMQLIDPDGRRTRYGDLSSGAGYGFNSIAKLTGYGVYALASALDSDLSPTSGSRWKAQLSELRDRERVVASSTRTNLRVFGITNFSNDLMAWNLYRALVPLARRRQDPALEDLLRGVRKAHARVEPDRNPYFQLVECAILQACSRETLEQVREFLVCFPTEKRRVRPSPELDQIPRRWLPGRKGRIRARSLVPIELRPPESFEWKANPYRVTGVTSPSTEFTGLDYLSAYWLYRFVAERVAEGFRADDYI